MIDNYLVSAMDLNPEIVATMREGILVTSLLYTRMLCCSFRWA
jgi:hypothetical protein